VQSAWLILIFASCTCRPPEVTKVTGLLRAAPAEVDFGDPWTQTTVRRTVTITNDARGTFPAAIRVEGETFSAAVTELELAPGDTRLELTSSAVTSGRRTGLLTITMDGQRAEVKLTVLFRDPPDCGEASECATFRFDRTTSQCLVEARADGLECGSTDRCLIDGRCLGGECVGNPVRCDDADPCTVDVCETVRGCVGLPRECPSPSPCLVGVCSRPRGCEVVPAVDGLRCGDTTTTSCTAVEICLNGTCVARDPPDGYLCAPSTPCRSEGRCLGDACAIPPARALQPTWMLGQDLLEDGGYRDTWMDVFFDHDGGVVLSSYFASPPMLQAPAGPRLPMPSRRCISWNELIVCADGPAQSVVAYSSATGQQVWIYQSVLYDLPALSLIDWQTFLARLVGLGPQRVGALFESRRIDDQRDSNCRRFSLVVLDRLGQRTVARIVEDPIFATCNHPHSYGVAADPQGNVFLAFTPSAQVSPALPDPNAAGTVIMSYSPAGVLRWRHFIANMPGGEISVGRGLITVEAGRSIYDSARGVEVGRLTIPFGEGIISNDWVVAGPKGPSAELVEPGRALSRVHWEAPALVSARSGLRGASWRGAPIALRLHQGGGVTMLDAVSLGPFQQGQLSSAWACEIADGGAPTGFEVRPGGLAVMTDPQPGGAGLCENCDPPAAGTRGLFFEVDVPGLELPKMPWPGPWGGPSHDHQED
jgi:hypothetical protein